MVNTEKQFVPSLKNVTKIPCHSGGGDTHLESKLTT